MKEEKSRNFSADTKLIQNGIEKKMKMQEKLRFKKIKMYFGFTAKEISLPLSTKQIIVMQSLNSQINGMLRTNESLGLISASYKRRLSPYPVRD